MEQWWTSLTTANQIFYGAAAFFSVFFLWQLIAALVGLAGGHGDVDVHADVDAHFDAGGHPGDIEAASATDALESAAAFRLVSVRSILAFFMMFSWAGALYLNNKLPLREALAYAILWGAAGLILAAGLIYMLRRLAETGTQRLSTAIGTTGTVYMNIPAGGEGKVRVTVSGVITFVPARAKGGAAISAGAPVAVTRKIGPNILEVAPVEENEKGNPNP